MVAHESERGAIRGAYSAVETGGAVERRVAGDRGGPAGRTLILGFGCEVRERLRAVLNVAAERVAGVCIDADLQRSWSTSEHSILAKSPVLI
jgi:hypothetical protein